MNDKLRITAADGTVVLRITADGTLIIRKAAL